MSASLGNLRIAERFYRALATSDTRTLLELLDPQLHAEITAGLPHGWGGVYSGSRDMLDRCWRPIFTQLAVRPVPREYLPCDEDRVVVLGRYHGHSRATGRQLDAAFAHVLRLRDQRIYELVQITDSARWHDALA